MKYYDNPAWYSAPAIFLSIAFFIWKTPDILDTTGRLPTWNMWFAMILVLLAFLSAGIQVGYSLRSTLKSNKTYIDDMSAYKKAVNINLNFNSMNTEEITAFLKGLKDLNPNQINALFCGQQIIEIEKRQKRSLNEKDRG